MYLKIFFGNKPLFLCYTIDETIQPYIHHDDTVFIDELNSHTIKAMIHEMQLTSVQSGVFFHENMEELKKAFFKKFTLILAAGGLIQNENDDILFIFRRGKWDLPKGKLDKGEKLENCAIREVQEETGLKNIKLLAPLMVTYHTYHEGTKFILKESHWYTMKVTGEKMLIPQKEENILEAIWVKATDLPSYRKDTFPSIEDVIEAFQKE